MNLCRQLGHYSVRHLKVIVLALCSMTPYAHAEDWAYTLRPGDDLWSIARTFCGLASAAEQIAQHNGINDPANVRAGERVNIPIELLVFEPASAKVVETSGIVTISRGASRTVQQVPARPGDILRMGNQLVTEVGFAVVEFADGSQLSLAPHSSVLFNKLTRFGPAGMIDTHLRFTYGRGRAVVQPQNQGDRFRIGTPGGIAAVRGTEFRVGHSGDTGQPLSTAETLEGHIQFDHSGGAYEVPAGFGVSVSNDGAVREALLPAPTWPDNYSTISLGQQVTWLGVANAEGYIVSWLTNDSLGSIVSQSKTTRTSAIADVDIGDYLFTVRAIAPSGIEGLDATRQLSVRTLAPQGLSVSGNTSGETTLEWTYPEPNASFDVTLNGPKESRSFKANGSSTTLILASGAYQWTVQAAESEPSHTHEFTLRPQRIRELAIQQHRKTLDLSWQPVDEPNASYEIVLTHSSDNTKTKRVEVTAPSTSIEVPRFGKYQISITAHVNGQTSLPLVEEVNVRRQPWWLFGIAALFLL